MIIIVTDSLSAALRSAAAGQRPRRTDGIVKPARRARPRASREKTGAACPVGGLLHRLAQKLHGEFELSLAPLGFSPPHYFVLVALSWHGPRSQLSLGTCAAINRTTMVSLIDHLERLGLVERRPDPKDRRAYIIHLTENGAGALERAGALHREAEARCLQPLSKKEQQALRNMLARLVPSPQGG
jgi:DNA-binding MarR family transcriptional regulator